MLKHDPIEEDEKYSEYIKLAEEEVSLILKDTPKEPGFVHKHDNLKKKILKEKYNIDWKTLSEMNPDVMID